MKILQGMAVGVVAACLIFCVYHIVTTPMPGDPSPDRVSIYYDTTDSGRPIEVFEAFWEPDSYEVTIRFLDE